MKKCLFLEINTFTIFYCLEWNMLITVVAYLISDTYDYFIIPMDKQTYLFAYYWIAYVISFYQLHYCFLMPSEIYKEYKEY